jgi:hypothetical protein
MSLDIRTRFVLLVNLIVILSGTILILLNIEVIKEVGVSIVASGLVTLFYFAYPRTNIEEKYNEIIETGLTGVYVSRDLKDEYTKLLRNVKRNIDVLGLALNKFREDNGDVVKAKCLEGVSVRFLVMDPESKFFEVKAKEEGDIAGEIIKAPHEKLKAYIEEVNGFVESKDQGKKIEIKYYKSTPSTMIFRIDDTMYIGPYLHKRISRKTCTFRLRKGSELFRQYEAHFEQLWNDSKFTRIP